ncbi:GntR family transcriptional regulator [Allorhizobium sp. BGMRC 0089]|uniref:GntR family transcriptional regulator n=1 Tax=Allorhizobium sonneratiae TaxID=2934936 RepID=UPI0020346BE6|nr:GntR family transcriptional regulator [Allorhizobium sonneratiae]MCM2293861.1 GntR family transcriptional regulator [Allorhizobium sonneratiae]
MIRAGTTVEQLVRSIADLIVTGEFIPGDKLDEVSLAARYEVSRTPVREALRELCAMGLVEREPNRRAVVTTINDAELRALFETMAELEAICARLSAERMTPEEKAELEAAHRQSHALVKSNDHDGYAAFNQDFHTLLYRGAHNQPLLDLNAQTRARLAPFRRAQFRFHERMEPSFLEHGQIVAAILAGDGRTAAAVTYDHILMARQGSARLTERN